MILETWTLCLGNLCYSKRDFKNNPPGYHIHNFRVSLGTALFLTSNFCWFFKFNVDLLYKKTFNISKYSYQNNNYEPMFKSKKESR